MNSTSVPFQTPLRPELALKRRGHSTPPIPFEADDIVPKERRVAGPYGMAALQAAWDKLYKARAILEAEQVHLRDDRIALQGEIDRSLQRASRSSPRASCASSSSSSALPRIRPRPTRPRDQQSAISKHDAGALRHGALGIRPEEVIWRASVAFPP